MCFLRLVLHMHSCTAAQDSCSAARRHRVAWDSGIWEPGLEAQGNIRLPVRRSPSAILIRHSGCKTSKVGCETGLHRPQRAWPLQATFPPVIGAPLNRRHRHPHPPARRRQGAALLWAALLIAVGCIAVLWVPGTASEGGLHLSGCLSAFPRHRQPALEPLHLCALHLLGTVFLPCLNIDIYLA